MRSTCKGKCNDMPEYETRAGNRGSFRLGYKRCRECEYFILYDGVRCPCCNGLLKSKPSNNTSRRKLREYNEKLRQVVQNMATSHYDTVAQIGDNQKD